MLGRWILIGLFGLRGICELLLLAPLVPAVVKYPSLFLSEPCLRGTVHVLFFLGSSAWLLLWSGLKRK
jgi:hypothetical protein